MKEQAAKRIGNSPIKLFMAAMSVVFLCEMTVMVVLYILDLRSFWSVVIDPVFLTILLMPVVCLFLVRPYEDLLARVAASQKKFRTLADLSPVAIFHTDVHGDCTYVNSTWRAITGLSAEQAAGRGYKRAIQHEDRDKFNEAWGQAVKTGADFSLRYRIKDAESNIRWVEGGASRIVDSAGMVTGYIGTFTDVTEHEHRKQSMEKAWLDADAANQSKTRFLANVSHDIRTPLNAIIGFGDLLAAEELTENQYGFAKTICSSGRHLLQLTNNILDLSKIETGRLDITMESFQIDKLFAAIESMMKPLATAKGLRFEIRQQSQMPQRIVTDRERLTQCLTNLVSNAIKFTETGHVFLDVSADSTSNKSNIRFDVIDTGIGIPPDKHELIFQAFTQVDEGLAREQGGAGLGLTITQQLVNLLGGELMLTSQPDEGSTFSITLPVEAVPEELAKPYREYRTHSQTPIDLSGLTGKALVVDDVRTNQMLAKLLLERMGLEVTLAENGLQALDRTAEQVFDIIFMDMQMPVMDGYEATRRIRNKGLNLPVIAVTAHAMKGDDQKCFDAGCDEYLPKPINAANLSRVIAKYLVPQGIS